MGALPANAWGAGGGAGLNPGAGWGGGVGLAAAGVFPGVLTTYVGRGLLTAGAAGGVLCAWEAARAAICARTCSIPGSFTVAAVWQWGQGKVMVRGCCGTLILMGVPQALQVYLSVGGFAMAYGGYRWGVAFRRSLEVERRKAMGALYLGRVQ